MAKIGVVMAGCGVNDGSEIYEGTLTLLHLATQGAEVVCMAPDMSQIDVIDHRTGQPVGGEERNVLTESARLARGEITNIADVNAEELDAVIFPGGFGAAKNLSDFAYNPNPDEMVVQMHVQQLVENMHTAGKPIGFICISPASIGAVALRGKGVKLTIGNAADFAEKVEALGNTHIDCAVEDIVIDDEHNIVSTPAYMLAQNILEAESGIEKLVAEICRRAG